MAGNKFEPQLCAKIRNNKGPEILAKDMAAVKWPMLISKKIDGIRGWNPHGTGLLSRTLKTIPNRHVQAHFGTTNLRGLDGELVHGTPYEDDSGITVMQKAQSATSTYNGPEDVDLHVFDWYDEGTYTFEDRYKFLQDMWSGHPRIHIVEQQLVHGWEEAEARLAEFLEEKFEGAILASPRDHYVLGRPTLSKSIRVKLKVWDDGEAEIIGFVESRENQNEATIDERGYTKRSGHKANKVGKDTLGALWCRSPRWSEPFKIGTGIGFNDALKQEIWDNQEKYLGATVTFKFNNLRTFKKPSLPSFRAIRWDI